MFNFGSGKNHGCLEPESSHLPEIPQLDPSIVTALERFRDEIECAPFHSREFNQGIPEMITEILRITREAQ